MDVLKIGLISVRSARKGYHFTFNEETLAEVLFAVFRKNWRVLCRLQSTSSRLSITQPRHVLNLFQNTVFSCLPNYIFYLFLIWSYPFLDWFHHFVHFLNLLNLNLKLAFSTSFKNTSCEHLGNPMRSSITQYLHIFDMWWNLSCLLARRVLSHTT